MKLLKDIDVKNKRVLLRTDFNVPIKDGKISEDFRIKATVPTIEYLISEGAKIILISHLARPEGIDERYSLRPIAEHISKLLKRPVDFVEDCLGDLVINRAERMMPGEIILLENLRFYPGETTNDSNFANQLASFGDVFVEDAFGAVHRAHASTVGLVNRLPSAAGFLLEKEVTVLEKILERPEHPLAVAIGGVKISTKIKVIKNFLERADNIMLGGALANTVISAKGLAIGKSITEEEMLDEVRRIELTDRKLHLPVDVIVSTDITGKAPTRMAPVGNTKPDEMILDVGSDTNSLYRDIITNAKTVIWNGPMGLLEVEEFANGTKEMARSVASSSAFKVVGGGDSIGTLYELGLADKIDHISTGGGAMLEFLAGEKLPGIEVLKNNKYEYRSNNIE